MGISQELKTVEDYESMINALRQGNAELLKLIWKSEDNFESLAIVHEAVCAECNELSETVADLTVHVAILSEDLDDMTIEFEALSEEYAVAFDVLAEHGLIEAVEVDEPTEDEAN